MRSSIHDTIGQVETGGGLSYVVVREGSELAERLRSRGWKATLGWRSESESGPVWLVRFEPDESLDGPAGC